MADLFITAMLAMDLARQKGLRFVIEDSFWDGHSRNPRNYTSWAWELTPAFRRASELRPEPGTGKSSAHLSYSAMLKKDPCTKDSGRWFRVDTASNKGCRFLTRTAGWCHSALPGALDRSLAAMPASDAFRLPHLVLMPASRSASPARVVWHIRTGDYRSPINDASMVVLRTMVDSLFPQRGATHYVATENQGELAKRWPHFLSLPRAAKRGDSTGDRVLDDLIEMVVADVLVSTGSSFSLSAAAIAPVGQLHLCFPPKEAWGNWLSAKAGTKNLTVEGIRRSGEYQTSFMRRNTVPIDAQGRPFAEYEPKLRQMALRLDAGDRASAVEASQSFETWLT